MVSILGVTHHHLSLHCNHGIHRHFEDVPNLRSLRFGFECHSTQRTGWKDWLVILVCVFLLLMFVVPFVVDVSVNVVIYFLSIPN